MYTQTPSKVMQLHASSDEKTNGLHDVFAMRRQTARELMDNLNTLITPQSLMEAVECISGALEQEVDPAFVGALLALYPQMRITIAMAGSVNGDTEARESVISALAHFLLGCPWPTYGDNVDIEEFSLLLKTQYGLFMREA